MHEPKILYKCSDTFALEFLVLSGKPVILIITFLCSLPFSSLRIEKVLFLVLILHWNHCLLYMTAYPQKI